MMRVMKLKRARMKTMMMMIIQMIKIKAIRIHHNLKVVNQATVQIVQKRKMIKYQTSIKIYLKMIK